MPRALLSRETSVGSSFLRFSQLFAFAVTHTFVTAPPKKFIKVKESLLGTKKSFHWLGKL